MIGLAALGPRVVQLMLLPSLQPYVALLGPKLSAPDVGAGAGAAARVAGALARLEALKVQGALQLAATHCVFRFLGPRWALAGHEEGVGCGGILLGRESKP